VNYILLSGFTPFIHLFNFKLLLLPDDDASCHTGGPLPDQEGCERRVEAVLPVLSFPMKELAVYQTVSDKNGNSAYQEPKKTLYEASKPVLRIRDVYPGSEFFHPGSQIPDQGSKKIRIPVPYKRI
jgi:hypothetical protein